MYHLSVQRAAHKVLRLTERMLVFAEHSDWSTFSEIEDERSRSMEYLFSHPDMPDAIQDIVYTLQRVLELDKRCIRLGETDRQALYVKLNSAGSMQAIQSYMQCAR